ncbi:unnamed protein product [Strongylus vulgaris]|uniref:E3 ubiquitin-protein ligase n=1 Tax=Strongylus vulgaris TaxID=40348 RepID=A0A3P7J9M1_STRVU|nr:unnamed protein product [Strongylus vulgaris]
MALHEQTRDPHGFSFTIAAEKEELLRSLDFNFIVSVSIVDLMILKGLLMFDFRVQLNIMVPYVTVASRYFGAVPHKFKEVQLLLKTGKATEKPKESAEIHEGVDDAKAKRAARAAKMREQAMMKMTKMQKSFLKVMETESPLVAEQLKVAGVSSERVDDDEDFVSRQSDHGFPVCLGPHRSIVEVVLPRKVTCILCQEEETLTPSNGKAFVCAAYVQK